MSPYGSFCGLILMKIAGAEAGDGLFEVGRGGVGEFDGELGRGGLLEERRRIAAGVGDEELGRGQGLQRGGEREVLMEEKRGRHQVRALVRFGAAAEIAVGVLKDDGADAQVRLGESDGGGAAEADTVDDQAAVVRTVGGVDVAECCVGVLLHALLGGVIAGAAAKAAIVKEQDVEAGVMQGKRGRESVAHGAFAVVQDERGRFSGVCGGNPPAVELGLAGRVDAEVDLGEGKAFGRRGSGEGVRGRERELPLTAHIDDTHRDVGEKDGDEERSAESLEDKGRIDELRLC